MTMAAELSDTEVARRVVDAIQKVRRQKQRPTAERIRHMLERDGDDVTSSDVDQLLDLAVSSGTVERIYNTSGIVSYKELADKFSSSSTTTASKASGDAVHETCKVDSKPKSKSAELQPKKLKKVDRSRSTQLGSVCHETVSPDCKPVLVVDKHADLSDVVLQVILRLGCASGKAVEKDIRSHYRVDLYPGSDIRRHIRTACKSLVRQQQLHQKGNTFVLMADDDDAADVTLTVDEPTSTTNKSAETPEDLMSPSLFICSECKEIEEDQTNVVTCAECGVGKHVKCMREAARTSLTSCPRLWLCCSCKPCSVCLVSGRTRKLRLGGMLVCELCDRVYHPECCGQSAPRESSWLCAQCVGSDSEISDVRDMECSSPAVKRRRTSCSAHSPTTDLDDVLSRRSRLSGLASSTDDKSAMCNESSVDRPTTSSVDRPTTSHRADKSSSEVLTKPSKDLSMSPRVSISPLRSVNVQPSRKSKKKRIADRGKSAASAENSQVSDHGRLSSGLEKSRSESQSESGSELGQSSASGGAARHRSRNMQLTSLFDSLTRFFSADSERRRRTAYVNATVSLAQSSLNPRHNFVSLQPQQQFVPQRVSHKARRQTVPKQTSQKSWQQNVAQRISQKSRQQTVPKQTSQKSWQQNVAQPISQKSQQHNIAQRISQKSWQQSVPPRTSQKAVAQQRAEKLQQLRARHPSRATDKAEEKTNTKTDVGRNTRTRSVKRPAESESVKGSAHSSTDAAEMNDLLMAPVAESESKLFHTAQTIAQQRLMVTDGVLSQSASRRCPVVIFDRYEFSTLHLSPYSHDFSGYCRLYVCEFCFKCLTSDTLLKRHQTKCPMRRPPGTEIYRRDTLSVFEVRGDIAGDYCSNLGMFARLFSHHESLYGSTVQQFTYYLLCTSDVCGSRLLGFFTKRVGGTDNLSCLLVLPPHRGSGYTQLMIALSYHLCRLSLCVGAPQPPVSDDLHAAHVFCWKAAVVDYLQKSRSSSQRVGLTVSDISQNTGISLEHVSLTLNVLRLASNKDTGTVDVSASKLKDCMRQFTLSRKLQVTLDSSLINWTATTVTSHDDQVRRSELSATSRQDTLRTLQSHLAPRRLTDSDTKGRLELMTSGQQQPVSTANTEPVPHRTSRPTVSRFNQSHRRHLPTAAAGSRKTGSQGRVKKPLVQRNDTTGRSGTTRRPRQVRVGVRRSPRAHSHGITTAVLNDEQADEAETSGPEASGPETGIIADSEVTVDTPEKKDSLCPTVLSSTVENERPVTNDEDNNAGGDDDGNTDDGDDGDADDGEGDDGDGDADEVVDVVEDDSTTRSLSTSLSPYETQQTQVTDAAEVERDVTNWLCDADTTHNSLLFDADATMNSMSSEADSVDVVSSLAVDDSHVAVAATTSLTLMSSPSESHETGLQELEEFVGRSTHIDDVDKFVGRSTHIDDFNKFVNRSTHIDDVDKFVNRSTHIDDVDKFVGRSTHIDDFNKFVGRSTHIDDVDKFVNRSTHIDDVDKRAAGEHNTAGLSQSYTQLNQSTFEPGELTSSPQVSQSTGELTSSPQVSQSTCQPQLSTCQSGELTSSPQLVSSTAVLAHAADVRGAMWRDSLFPSDFPPEPPSSYVSVGKPNVDRGGKASLSVQRTSSLDWEAGRPHVDVTTDNQSAQCAASASAHSYHHTFPPTTPPVSNPQYLYGNVVDKSLDLPGSSSYRYNSGRRSVSDGYSRGLAYDGGTQHQRAASVRPAAAAASVSVDAQRLSHMWTGAPLPAHQHHVSLSHLQHLVTDDLQYTAAAPLSAVGHMSPPSVRLTSPSSVAQNAAAEFVRPCQQRQHGSRQQHKTHHKHTTTTSSQPVHCPPASLTAAAAAGYDMFSACRIQQPISYFPHQGAAAALPMGVVGLHHAQMVAAAANFGQPMPAGQAANSAMYSAAAAAAYSYLNGGGLQPFNVDINSVMRR